MKKNHIDILEDPFRNAGFDVHPVWNAQMMPYNGNCWNLDLPTNVNWENTVVIVELTDYMTITNNCAEMVAIEKHFGVHCNQVLVVHWHPDLHNYYDGPLNHAFFPTHSHELFSQLLPSNLKEKRFNKYQCLNGFPKKHREQVVNYLVDNGYVSNAILSLGSDIRLPEWNYASYARCDNVTNWERLWPTVYSKCSINIVNETIYYNPGIITEKTLFAFLALQIPIVIGHRGIVQQCREHGFDMFDDIVNTHYDSLSDDVRWKEAIDSNIHLLHHGFPNEIIVKRLENNRDHLLTGWLDKLENDFNNSVQGMIQSLHRTL